MFITDEDYLVVIGETALKTVSQVSADIRRSAELEAQEEISGYLRPKYDCDAIFAAADTDRNKLIVMYTCDIALYHMSAAIPGRMGSEVRKERYDRAVKWMEGVQAGKIIPDIPVLSSEAAINTDGGIIYGCQERQDNMW